ncbi:MAG: hypothetical protein KME15_20590 [Drouetiella hepatica Uher 2000/2452]|jgi:predicted O-linked N-acetylglucosamine transferase (SPINDLY family)|uniref:Uncharacterized protein n=1 Tax=Drouetiella hepatica Uher 2000/2452 TaxID=904376 RepID=A0A951QFT8_9CYAN|nr:hypothetical protein [Drouetiella hepatica Uher 2000/2452]
METQDRVSLHGFCRDNNLPKSTVYERCKTMGIITSDGLCADDCDRLLKEFNVKPAQVHLTAESVSLTRPHVESGNHQIVLTAPALPLTLTLENLRTGTVASIADPLSVAAAFLENADALIAAMNGDLHRRQQELQQTASAKEAVAQKAQELKLESRLYQQNAGAIDQAQNQATAQLSTALEALQSFTKKPDGESEPSS